MSENPENIIKVAFEKKDDHLEELKMRILDAIEFDDTLNVSETIGVLELIKHAFLQAMDT